MNYKVRKMVLISMFATIALVIFTVEFHFPLLSPFPGIKPGLANIITLFILNLKGTWKARDALTVLLIRILLAAFIVGQPTTLFYSLGGGISAYFVMVLLMKTTIGKYPPFLSIIGALAHNITQLIIAAFFLSTPAILNLLPMHLASSAITGLLTGFSAKFLLNRSKFIKKISNL